MQLTAPPSPALDFIRRNTFLTRPDADGIAPVKELRPVDATTVELVVSDPWVDDAARADGADAIYADTAAAALESVVGGVKLIVRTPDGHVGRDGWFSGDEQYFANTLPGLTSQAAEVAHDVDGDGTIGDEEAAFVFPVATRADAERLDPLVRETISGYPVRFEVEGDVAER